MLQESPFLSGAPCNNYANQKEHAEAISFRIKKVVLTILTLNMQDMQLNNAH